MWDLGIDSISVAEVAGPTAALHGWAFKRESCRVFEVVEPPTRFLSAILMASPMVAISQEHSFQG
jgi:hypothetical protein